MPADNQSADPRSPVKVAYVLIPRFNMMTLTSTIEPARIANYLSPSPLYEWTYLSFDGQTVTASNGLSIQCEPADRFRSTRFDLVFIVGSWGCEHYRCNDLSSWLRWLHLNGVMLCAMEMGIYILAGADLLSGRLATTHWSMSGGFAEQYPRVKLTEQLFTVDDKLITCCGGTAGIDLMLHLIATRHGNHLAAEISDQMIHHPVRAAGSPQRHTHGGGGEPIHPYIDSAIKLLESNIMDPLRVPDIARHVGISQRQLERYFKQYLGCSVVQFSQLMRLQYARVLLTSTDLSIREVSVASGFNSMSHFANAFITIFGKKPSHYRLAWPDNEPAPNWPGTVFSLVETARVSARKHRSGSSVSRSG